MQRWHIPTGLALVLLLGGALSAGCGGSGTSARAPARPAEGLFSGTYRWVRITRDVDLASLFAEVGTAVPFDDGSLELSVLAIEDGSSAGPSATPATWTLDGARALVVETLASSLTGRLSVDGSLACAVDAGPGHDPSFLLLVQQAQGASLASLAGVWSVAVFRQSTSTTYEAASLVAEATIDPDGTVHWAETTFNFDGDIDPIVVVAPDTHLTLDAEGNVDHLASGNVTQTGGLSSDGNLIVVAGDIGAAEIPSIYVFMRRGQATATTAITGSYRVLGLDATAGSYGVSHGVATADGSALLPMTTDRNGEGGVTAGIAQAFGVAVASDGALDLTPTATDPSPPEPTLRGAVGTSADWLVVGGGVAQDDPVALLFLIR